MTSLILVAVGALYVMGIRRYDARHSGTPFPRKRVVAFLGGVAALAVALVGPVDRLAGERFSWHMVQHLLLTMVAPPLILLGRPVTLARRAAPAGTRRMLTAGLRSPAAHVLSHPLIGWMGFTVILWGTHFTDLYQAALGSPWIHIVEHALYVGAGLLFWLPVVGAEPSGRRMGYPSRILYLLAAAPVGALLASTVFQSERVLYSGYAGPGGLADQRVAGALMWIGGGLLVLLAVLLVAAAWARRERAPSVEAERSGAGRADQSLGSTERTTGSGPARIAESPRSSGR